MTAHAVCKECGVRWEVEGIAQPRSCPTEGCEAGWLDIPLFADPADADRYEKARAIEVRALQLAREGA